MKKFWAFLAIVTVILTFGTATLQATQDEDICWEKCEMLFPDSESDMIDCFRSCVGW